MSVKTSLECAHCGHIAQTSKYVPPGARVKCPKCGDVFHILPAAGGLVATIPVIGDLTPGALTELFASDTPPRQTPASEERENWAAVSSDAPVIPRAAGPASGEPSKVSLEGKPLPFQKSRALIAGIVVALLVLAGYGFASWYARQVTALTNAAEIASAQREAKYKAMEKLATAKSLAAAKNALAKGTAAFLKSARDQGGAPALLPFAPQADLGVAIAPATAQIGDLVVGVSEARLGPLNRSTVEEVLSLTLRITNLSARPMSVTSWARSDVRVVLRDRNRNYYNRVSASSEAPREVDAGQTITEKLTFEPTPEGVELELDLPVADSSKPFRFRMPTGFVRRSFPPIQSAQANQTRPQPAPAAPVPYDPEKDPKLCSAVNAEYREGMKRIDRRALGVSFDRANKLRQTEPPKLIKSLAKKHNLEEDQVRRIVGLE
jgi:hypothetical protein